MSISLSVCQSVIIFHFCSKFQLLSKISEGFDCKGGALIMVPLVVYFFAEFSSLSEVSLTVTGVLAEASASCDMAETLVRFRLPF